jgi:hypothetical protein
LAKKLGYKSFSIIEFGVAGGNGIYFLEKFCEKVRLELNIEIEIYGFDLKDGLSNPKDYKELPYWFQSGFYSMNESEFTDMVKAVREAEKAIGSVAYELTHKQLKGRDFSRSLYVVKDIKNGEQSKERKAEKFA